MTPLTAFFLGLLTMILIIIPFWFLSTINASIKSAYQNTLCYSICA